MVIQVQKLSGPAFIAGGHFEGFFKVVPDSSLELEWQLMKRVQMEPGPIPNKYRNLIGLAIAAAIK